MVIASWCSGSPRMLPCGAANNMTHSARTLYTAQSSTPHSALDFYLNCDTPRYKVAVNATECGLARRWQRVHNSIFEFQSTRSARVPAFKLHPTTYPTRQLLPSRCSQAARSSRFFLHAWRLRGLSTLKHRSAERATTRLPRAPNRTKVVETVLLAPPTRRSRVALASFQDPPCKAPP